MYEQVELSAFKRIQQIAFQTFFQVQFDSRIALGDVPIEGQRQRMTKAWRHCDGHNAVRILFEIADTSFRFGDLLQNLVGVPQKLAAGIRQLHASLAPVEQLRPKLGFKALYVQAQRGLRDIQALDGARQAF